MSVGLINGYESVIKGNVQVILCDADGNIKRSQITHNVINAPYIFSAFFSGWFGGNGLSVCTRYIYLMSINNASAYSPSSSISSPFSGVYMPVGSCLNASSNVTANPLSASATFGAGVAAGICSWVVTGTFCFSGNGSDAVGALSSVGGVALMWDPTQDALAAYLSVSWFAHATFAQIAITSNDKLSIHWYFCMCTSTQGA